MLAHAIAIIIMLTMSTMPTMPTIVGSYKDGVFTPSMVATAIRNAFNKGAGHPVPAQGIKLNAYNDEGDFVNYWSCRYQWTPQDMWEVVTSQKWDTNGYSHDELQWKLEVLGKEVANVYAYGHRYLCIDWYDANRKGRTIYWIGKNWWVPCAYYYEERRDFSSGYKGCVGGTCSSFYVNKKEALKETEEYFQHFKTQNVGEDLHPVYINDNGVIDDCGHHCVEYSGATFAGYEYVKYSKDETAKSFVKHILEEDILGYVNFLEVASLGVKFSSRKEIEEFVYGSSIETSLEEELARTLGANPHMSQEDYVEFLRMDKENAPIYKLSPCKIGKVGVENHRIYQIITLPSGREGKYFPEDPYNQYNRLVLGD